MADHTGKTKTRWERHRIVIAAAVAAVLGRNARITSIRPAALSSPWAASGRRLAVQISQGLANRRGVPRVAPERGVER